MVIFKKEIFMETILKNFLTEGKLTKMPSKRKMKLWALLYLGSKFEAGKTYTEKEVNELLKSWHTFGDPATLRRELYNHRIIDRSPDGAEYRLEEHQPTYEELEKLYG